MAKASFGLYLDQELIEMIDRMRREQGLKKNEDVSRSHMITQLVKKALEDEKA